MAGRFEHEGAGRALVGDDHRVGRGARALRRFGHDQRHRLAEILHLVAGKLRLGPGVAHPRALAWKGAWRGAFSCVITSSTPGMARAVVASMPVMRPQPIVAVTIEP